MNRYNGPVPFAAESESVFYKGADFWVVVDSLGSSLIFISESREPLMMYNLADEFDDGVAFNEFVGKLDNLTESEVVDLAKSDPYPTGCPLDDLNVDFAVFEF